VHEAGLRMGVVEGDGSWKLNRVCGSSAHPEMASKKGQRTANLEMFKAGSAVARDKISATREGLARR
jgi:hypothetical protein